MEDNNLLAVEVLNIESPKDLGGDGKELPPSFVAWVKENLPEAEIKTERVSPPPGMLGLLVPKTTIAIRIPAFLTGVVKASLGVALLATTKVGGIATTSGVLTFTDGTRELLGSVTNLKKNIGQLCTYKSAVDTAGPGLLSPNRFFNQEQLTDTHKVFRSTCEISSCKHFDSGCTITQDELDKLVDVLVTLDLLKNEDNQLSVKF